MTEDPAPGETSTEPATAYDAHATEARWYAEWLRRGYFHAVHGLGPGALLHRDPAAERHRRAPHRPRPGARRSTTSSCGAGGCRGSRRSGSRAPTTPASRPRSWSSASWRRRASTGARSDGRRSSNACGRGRTRYGDRIVEQMQALGDSCDWDRLRFTMDEGLAHAVRVAFVRMYEAGLIYRGERLVNWCPKDTTALSDSEVEHEDVAGELVTFRYQLADGSGHVDVATTRVETMLGDTGHRRAPGRRAIRRAGGEDGPSPVPRRRDPRSSPTRRSTPTFGTGAVKVTPAHDPTDFEIGQRHGLAMRNILDREAAHLNDSAPGGLPRPRPRTRRGRGFARRSTPGPGRRRRDARTCTRWATATGATRRSSPGCPGCSGSSRSNH